MRLHKSTSPMRHFLALLSITLANYFALAQAPPLPAYSLSQLLSERWSVRTGADLIHLAVRPYSRQDAVALARNADTTAALPHPIDHWMLQYVFDDNNEWLLPEDSLRLKQSRKPIIKHLYRTPAHLYEVNIPAFRLRVNPILHATVGRERGEAKPLFLNQRGIEVRGDVDGRLFFYTDLLETQVRFADYVNRWVATYQSMPGAGFFKPYRSEFLRITDAYDYNIAQAGVGFCLSRHVSAQMGHGRFFIGHGQRSLFLSDVGNVAFFLRLSTRVWKLHYQTLFLELSPISTAVPRPPNSLLPKKYAAAHYLSWKPRYNLEFGFFEATTFNRSRQFEWQYLNPVILYRTVEGMLGSPDNVLIGFQARWDIARCLSLYGQFLLDELFSPELFGRNRQGGWWGNKYGGQFGLKYFDAFGIPYLDLQLESNAVRPYTYSSFDSLNSHTHYSLPLAHPLWANFQEVFALVRYQPHPKWTLAARTLWALKGEDPEGQNWGGNPLLSNASRARDYGNHIGQGIRTHIRLYALELSWQWKHNLFWEAQLLWRSQRQRNISPTPQTDTLLFNIGVRWNAWYRMADF